jgi:molybdenum cofactor cytidylyltransferase
LYFMLNVNAVLPCFDLPRQVLSDFGRSTGTIMKSRVVLVVLAAGQGSRFKSGGHNLSHKLSQKLGTSTVLGTTLGHALISQLSVVVVTTAALAPLAQLIVASSDVVVIPEVGGSRKESGGKAVNMSAANLGMGYSIAHGVLARPQASGWLVLPGDMPMVHPDTLRAVAAQLEHHAVVYAQHLGRRGHPVGFGAELYSELVALQGDEGARRLVARYPAHAVDVQDAGVLLDVDTPDDLEQARQNHAAIAMR